MDKSRIQSIEIEITYPESIKNKENFVSSNMSIILPL